MKIDIVRISPDTVSLRIDNNFMQASDVDFIQQAIVFDVGSINAGAAQLSAVILFKFFEIHDVFKYNGGIMENLIMFIYEHYKWNYIAYLDIPYGSILRLTDTDILAFLLRWYPGLYTYTIENSDLKGLEIPGINS